MSPTLPDLVDSHCHLDFPDLIDETEAILARAKAAGVNRMVTICTRLRNEPQVRAIAEDKMQDMNAFTLKSAMSMVAGTARSMGITVSGTFPQDVN